MERPELEFLKSLWGLGTEEEEGYRTGPPGYIGWRNSFLGIHSGAPYTSKNTGSGKRCHLNIWLGNQLQDVGGGGGVGTCSPMLFKYGKKLDFWWKSRENLWFLSGNLFFSKINSFARLTWRIFFQEGTPSTSPAHVLYLYIICVIPMYQMYSYSFYLYC